MAQIQICRTCLEVIRKPSMFVTLDGNNAKSKEVKSKLEACVPEMTINTVKGPVICGRCLISLNASYEFKRKCIATEEEIYSYIFDTDVDVLDLQLIAKQCPVDKSHCFVKEIIKENIKQEVDGQSVVCKTEVNETNFEVEEKEDYEDFLPSAVKDETMDSYFEATDNMLYSYDSKEFSTIEDLITFESQDEETSIEETDIQPTSLPNCNVVLTRLSDDILKNLSFPNIEVEHSFNDQITQSQKSSNTKKKRPYKHRKYSEQNNECYVCYPYNSSTVEPMKIKKRLKISDDEKSYRCGLCNYNSSIKLNIHLRTHTGEKPNRCDVCGFATAYRYHLKNHMKIHSKNESHDCAYCEFSVDSVIELKDHMNFHPGCKMYKCDNCEFSTDNLKDLKCHVVTHSGKQIYECATCGFKTFSRSFLICHIRVHSKEKPYRCDKCPFSTAYHSSLTQHSKSHAVNMQQF